MRGAAVYEVSAAKSEVHILVYRGGALSRLGHDHVVTSRALSGRVWLHPDFPSSGFELSFPVNELIVDDPQSRHAVGGDFPPDIPPADKEGTHRNMLRPEVLDAQRYPHVSLRSTEVTGSFQFPRLTARVTIKDASRDIEIPATLALEGTQLTASGEFDVVQTQFGIKPFSIALGALEVQDRLHVRFSIVAEKIVAEKK